MKRRYLVLPLFLVILLLLGYVAARRFPTSGDGEDLAADIRHYQSVSEWLNSKYLDHIVSGQVISKGEGRIIPRPGMSPEVQKRIEQAGGTSGTIVTDYTFKINRVIKGKGLNPGDTITIVQSGGTVDGRTSHLNQTFRPIEVGEQAILSLVFDTRDPTVSDASKKYTVLLNPEARYRIVDGRIELMPGDWQQLPSVREFQSLQTISESEFTEKAQRLVTQ